VSRIVSPIGPGGNEARGRGPWTFFPSLHVTGMRRRAFVAAGGASLLAAAAGCTVPEVAPEPGDGTERHPFAGTTVTVAIENRSTTDHDIERNAREALTFWEAESSTYAGFDVTCSVRATTTSPARSCRTDPRTASRFTASGSISGSRPSTPGTRAGPPYRRTTRAATRGGDEAYLEATTLYDRAGDYFSEARAGFARNRDRTDEFEGNSDLETVDLSGLRGHFDRLVDVMGRGVEFASLMAEAARFRADGEIDSANDRIRRANDSIAEFNESPRPEPRDVAVALGLVRGFDREDEPVTVDGEDG